MYVKFDKSLTEFIRSKMVKYGYRAPHHYGMKWNGEPESVVAEYQNALTAFQKAYTLHRAAVTERQRLEAKSLRDKA